MFGNLSDRLTQSFRSLRSRGVLTESDVDRAISDIRRALIDADVALPVVRQFTTQVREKAYGAARSKALNPGQQVVSIVHEELVEILGGATRELTFAQSGPTVFMLAGLQGAGKTSAPMPPSSFRLSASAPASRCGRPSPAPALATPSRSRGAASSLPARAASTWSSSIRPAVSVSTRR